MASYGTPLRPANISGSTTLRGVTYLFHQYPLPIRIHQLLQVRKLALQVVPCICGGD